MGTYEIYIVRLFSNGTFIKAARHELVKGSGDRKFGGEFRQKFGISAQNPSFILVNLKRKGN